MAQVTLYEVNVLRGVYMHETGCHWAEADEDGDGPTSYNDRNYDITPTGRTATVDIPATWTRLESAGGEKLWYTPEHPQYGMTTVEAAKTHDLAVIDDEGKRVTL